MTLVRYLTHPQVIVDPQTEISAWSLSATGRQRVAALAASQGLTGTTRVISSAETKAVETAQLLADALKCPLEVRPGMHENDRSATGFLAPDAFEATADLFFAHPEQSIRGWETARAAQERIVAELHACLARDDAGDILIVGHGGVGTLLYCYLANVAIDRSHDQGSGGGGNYFAFSSTFDPPVHGWRAMEELYQRPG